LKLPWLAADTPFPPAEFALTEPDGLLAAGADLSPERLIQAYSNGIFPWYSEGEPVLWWSPDPRMVLAIDDFSPSHSLRKLLRQIASQEYMASPRVQVRVDTVFPQVMAQCAAPRDGQPGTWITSAMQQAYAEWHRAGYVHSIETWIDGELAGGLYGISLGRMFFGESMFTRAPNASKIALAYLVAIWRRKAWNALIASSRHSIWPAWAPARFRARSSSSMSAMPRRSPRFPGRGAPWTAPRACCRTPHPAAT